MRKTFAIISLSMMVAACAQPAWIYNGKRYEDGELMKRDMASVNDAYLSQLKPLAKPVTNRELKIIVPQRSYFMNEKLNYIKVGFPNATMEQLEKNYLVITSYDDGINLWRRIEKKNIFPKVSQSYVSDASGIMPSDDYDVMVLSVASRPPAFDQWYYISKRNGKQAIHFDVNLTEVFERSDSQLDAIKAAAMQ